MDDFPFVNGPLPLVDEDTPLRDITRRRRDRQFINRLEALIDQNKTVLAKLEDRPTAQRDREN